MRDITQDLFNTMNEQECNPMVAFLILLKGENYVRNGKSEPEQEVSRGLFRKSNSHSNE